MGCEIAVKEHAAYTVANGRGRLWRATYQVGPDHPWNRIENGLLFWAVTVEKRRDIVDGRWDPTSISIPSIRIMPCETWWLIDTAKKARDIAQMLDRCLPTGSEV